MPVPTASVGLFSDVLLRHRRRCHPEEAALTEPVKAAGLKKPPRPRNLNPQRPYPPRAPKPVGANIYLLAHLSSLVFVALECLVAYA